jgi:hypothetical protein
MIVEHVFKYIFNKTTRISFRNWAVGRVQQRIQGEVAKHRAPVPVPVPAPVLALVLALVSVLVLVLVLALVPVPVLVLVLVRVRVLSTVLVLRIS